MHRHYTQYYRRCLDCEEIAMDCSQYCEHCNERWDAENAAQQELDAREAQEEDSVPYVFPCTCRWPYVPSNARTPLSLSWTASAPSTATAAPIPTRRSRSALTKSATETDPTPKESTMYASASFHDVTAIAASSTRTSGAPLTLDLYGADGRTCTVTIFTGSQDRTDALIAAINRAGGRAEPVAPHLDDYRD